MALFACDDDLPILILNIKRITRRSLVGVKNFAITILNILTSALDKWFEDLGLNFGLVG